MGYLPPNGVTMNPLPNLVKHAYTITDGVCVVSGGYPTPRTWATVQEAQQGMASLCWHPLRFAGPFRVEPCEVHLSHWGTVLDVKLIAS